MGLIYVNLLVVPSLGVCARAWARRISNYCCVVNRAKRLQLYVLRIV